VVFRRDDRGAHFGEFRDQLHGHVPHEVHAVLLGELGDQLLNGGRIRRRSV
jgi:hypothetical protein